MRKFAADLRNISTCEAQLNLQTALGVCLPVMIRVVPTLLHHCYMMIRLFPSGRGCSRRSEGGASSHPGVKKSIQRVIIQANLYRSTTTHQGSGKINYL